MSSSIHIHSDGQSGNKFATAQWLFGADPNSLRLNGLGTIEMHSALAGYIDNQFDEACGYPELPPPAIIELLHSCSEPDSALFLMLQQRVGYTDWRSRLGDKQAFCAGLAAQYEQIMKNGWSKVGIDFRAALVEQFANLSPEQQTRVIDMMRAEGNTEMSMALGHNIGRTLAGQVSTSS